MFKLTKTVSIITGASKGIGKSIAECFASAGSHVVCVSRSEKSLKNVQNKTNLKGANLWLPLRYAITLEVKGPDLNLIVDLFGKDKCLRLVERAIEI